MGGFSYRGKNIGDFGEIYYAPDASERGEYALPYKVDEQEINGRDGAYYYGNHVEPREFVLRCYYEELTQRDKEDIMHWFGRNTKGRLIFDERDYVYYDVIPNARVEFDDYRGMTCNGLRYKGILTIYLKAYCPFGKLLPGSMVNNVPAIGIDFIVGVSIIGEATLAADDETIVLYKYRMPSTNYDVTGTSFYIYNMGTEATPLRIKIAGTAESGTITNVTNGKKCVINGMTTGNTTDVGKSVYIDAETGRVTLVGSLDTQLAFEMHDYGYIWLDPCTPFVRDIEVSYTDESKTITSAGLFTEDMVGQFIWLHGTWRKIAQYNGKNGLTLESEMDATDTETTQIVTMNEITFDGFTLTKLEMDFTPRMR